MKLYQILASSFASSMSSSIALIALLAVIVVLTGCGTTITSCPPPTYMDEKVAEELVTIPFEGYEDLYDWLAEIEVLNEQLDECQ